jgi:hypothetical protein
MDATSLHTLKPNVTRQDAQRAFSVGASAHFWRLRSGPLQRIAEAYVPYRGYRVRYNMAGVVHSRFFALDGVTGSLDLFEFPKAPDGEQLIDVQTRNHLPSSLSSAAADDLLRDKALRAIFLQGFFKLRGGRINVTREGPEFYIPYWLGFHGTANMVRCRVLDAVRRRIEGAKATALFEQWLAA